MQYSGDYFVVSALRVRANHPHEDVEVSAITDEVEGTVVHARIFHANRDGELVYLLINESGLIEAEFEHLDELSDVVLDRWTGQLALDKAERGDLGQHLCIGDDADYDLDDDHWEWRLNSMGALETDAPIGGALVVNVQPHYEAELSVEGGIGTLSADANDEHEFVGIRRR